MKKEFFKNRLDISTHFNHFIYKKIYMKKISKKKLRKYFLISKLLLILSLMAFTGCKKDSNNAVNNPSENTSTESLSINRSLENTPISDSKKYNIIGKCDSSVVKNVLIAIEEPQITTEVPCKSNVFKGSFDINHVTSDTITIMIMHDSDTQNINVNHEANHFITKWNIPSDDYEFTLPLKKSSISQLKYDFTVDWGDNSGIKKVTSFDDIDKVHTYENGGTYTITIMGSCEGFQNSSSPFNSLLLEVVNLGHVGWKDLSRAFENNSFLTKVFGGNTSDVIDMSYMFSYASLATPDTTGWDTSNVANMTSMFKSAFEATPDTSNWNTSKVTNMNEIFQNAYRANPDTSRWNFTSVTSFNRLFQSSDLSVENYSKFLIQLHENIRTTGTNIQRKNIDVGALKYNDTTVGVARHNLIYGGWAIKDGGFEE